MPRKGLLKGRKISSRHQTVIPAAEVVIRAAKALPEVSKVVLGLIAVKRPGPARLRFTPIQAGFRLKVCGGFSVQTLFVYTSSPVSTQASIEQAWAASRR